MRSLGRVLLASLLLAILNTSAVAAAPDCSKSKQDVQQSDLEFQRLLDQADPPSLHSALHDYSPKKFRHGMFEKDRTAAEMLHRDDASLASSIVSLAKRQSNSTGITTSLAKPGVSSTPVAGQSPTTPVVAPGPSDTSSPGAGSSPSGPTTTTSTSTSALAPGSTPTTSNPAVASGSTTSAPGSSPSLTNGELVTTTNAQGITIVSTVGGGYRTLSPSGKEKSSMTSSPHTSESHTTTSRRTTTLPDGSKSTVTAVTVVGGGGADTAAPSGTAGAGSTGTGTGAPGLQTGVATRMSWGMEVLAVVGGAVGVAVMM